MNETDDEAARQPIGGRIKGSGKALAAAGVFLFAAVWLVAKWGTAGEPEKRGSARKSSAAAGGSSRPAKKPAVPALELNVPVLVPGLEEIDPAYGPSLTHDLTVLVFAGAGKKRGDYDLFIAKRTDPASSFSKPSRMDACSSGRYETFPTLSPGGLELLFLRFEAQPKLYYARRDTLDETFGKPEPWAVAESLPPGRRPGAAQFIDETHVQFVTHGKTASEDRQLLLTDRKTQRSKFGEPAPLEFTQAPVPQFVASDRLRSYFGLPNGLLVAARDSEAEPFEMPTRISDIPADGPVWVVPKEGVIFFCSPGFGGQVETSRKLWMLRF
ncbi:MAG: hypothetical protein ACREHD_29335 [Pirellulales bacterium]